jgi:amino-acid N-acetyltransferase
VEQSPKFSQYKRNEDTSGIDEPQAHHLALVKLTDPQNLDDATMQGIGLTLSQLFRLSMTPCVVLDCGRSTDELGRSTWRQKVMSQAHRLEQAIHRTSGVRARILDNIYTFSAAQHLPRIFSRKMLMAPLKSGQIAIVLPFAYSEETQTMRPITPNQAILALTREFAGLNIQSMPDEDSARTTQRVKFLQKQTSLDRLIILDPQGGIPRPAVPGSNHVFLNMEQEYGDVRKELQDHRQSTRASSSAHPTSSKTESLFSSMSGSASRSSQRKREKVAKDVFVPNQSALRIDHTQHPPPDIERHLENLDLLRDVLAYLPSSSSAVVTTPFRAAKSGKSSSQTTFVSSVGTRAQKNPLIHNLLTDKPAYSASLPVSRLGQPSSHSNVASFMSTPTFAKRGMPLTIIPDPQTIPWAPNHHSESRLRLTDPRIDFSRLVYLIDDSFNRKLDVEHYLDRVKDRIAGLIVAGEYEGGALFTWETPPGVSPSNFPRQIPYLDKFAVLKRSQGAGGVADIVFNAMVRDCFPKGVCWRSRRDNPVNRWYFERARGTWKLPGTNWTMFWTAEGVEAGDGERFKDYEAVCRGVEPSWADKKKTPD